MKLTYRISTALFIVLMLGTAITDLTRMDFVLQQVTSLGYPSYMPLLIGAGKLIGVVLLMVPRWKEWAYAGFTVLFISAACSHVISGDVITHVLPPLLMEALLLTSYVNIPKEETA